MKYTKYEKARIIGARALQLAMGAPFMLKLSDDDLAKINYSPIEIAKLELEKGVMPITVKRPFPKPEKVFKPVPQKQEKNESGNNLQ